MSTINEEKFKDTLKALVQDEPEKLAFFDGLEQPTAVPPFVPADVITSSEATNQSSETSDKQDERIKTTVPIKAIRRRYTYAMAAAAACFVVFFSITVAGLSPGMNMKTVSVSYDAMEAVAGGGGMDTGAMVEAPIAPDEAPAAAEAAEAQKEAPAETPMPAPAPVCDIGTGLENEAGDGSAEAPQVSKDTAEYATDDDMAGDDMITMGRGDDEPVSVAASTDTVFNITLIIAIISAALFVVFLVKRRKIR